jgi:hypothetical protein
MGTLHQTNTAPWKFPPVTPVPLRVKASGQHRPTNLLAANPCIYPVSPRVRITQLLRKFWTAS